MHKETEANFLFTALRSKDELVSDVLLLTITHERANINQPARTLH